MINITGHTGLTGLLGSPVAHSVSPLMHNEAFRYLGLDYVYLCFDVTEETLPQAVEGLKACGIKGFNLTMPNKNKIVELLDELSPTAQLMAAYVSAAMTCSMIYAARETPLIAAISCVIPPGACSTARAYYSHRLIVISPLFRQTVESCSRKRYSIPLNCFPGEILKKSLR